MIDRLEGLESIQAAKTKQRRTKKADQSEQYNTHTNRLSFDSVFDLKLIDDDHRH